MLSLPAYALRTQFLLTRWPAGGAHTGTYTTRACAHQGFSHPRSLLPLTNHEPEGYARSSNNLLEAQHMNCLASAKVSACDGNAAAVTEIHPKVHRKPLHAIVVQKGFH